MTSCGCFEAICAYVPECNGVMIVNREFLERHAGRHDVLDPRRQCRRRPADPRFHGVRQGVSDLAASSSSLMAGTSG